MKVAVNWEEADGIWKIIFKSLKQNQIKIGRKVKVNTTEKYKFNLRNLGRREYEDIALSTEVDTQLERDCIAEDNDCRPRILMVKTFWGKIFGLPLWKIVPFYNASYKSHKVLPWTKNTIIPMDPKMHQAMSENDSQFELLKRDTTSFNIMLGLLLFAMGLFAMYTFYPLVNSYVNPPANVTKTTSTTGPVVVRTLIALWLIPNLRRTWNRLHK